MIASLSPLETLTSARPAAPLTHSAAPERLPLPAELSLTSVTTLILWLSCASVGALGLTLPYTRPQPAKAAPPPVQFEKLRIELTHAPLPPPGTTSTPVLSAPPPLSALAQPNFPPPLSAATPSPTVAFAVPVEGPVQIVAAAQAGLTRTTAKTILAGPAVPVQSLVYGQGEGHQPAPSYPLHARDLGQEGAVTVQFTVDESGRVTAAQASQPSPWPLLNDSALRTIRQRWHFPPGALRSYEVMIHFRLRK